MKITVVVLAAICLIGCNVRSHNELISNDDRLALVRTSIEINKEENAAEITRSLNNAKNELAIAKIEAQVSTVRAKANADVNRLIEASIKNQWYLKNWVPETWVGTSLKYSSTTVCCGPTTSTCGLTILCSGVAGINSGN